MEKIKIMNLLKEVKRVVGVIALDMDITKIPPGSLAEMVFKNDVKRGLHSEGVKALYIHSITAGYPQPRHSLTCTHGTHLPVFASYAFAVHLFVSLHLTPPLRLLYRSVIVKFQIEAQFREGLTEHPADILAKSLQKLNQSDRR